MSKQLASIDHHQLTQLTLPILKLLSKTIYNPRQHNEISIKSHLQSLLSVENPNLDDRIRDFILCCALLSASTSSTSSYVNWIPHQLSFAANSAIGSLSRAIYGDLGFQVEKLVVDFIPTVVPLIKDRIKESSIDVSDDGDEISAACSRTPVAFAVVSAYQLRWLVTQVEKPELGKLCAIVIPCGLTALDHWSSEVKEQGMISFIHLAKNANAADIGFFGDVILDACHQNIVSSDEIWHLAVEMSVLFVTCLQRDNPRSPWFEKLLSEMLGHLERQPRNKERRIAWLKLIEPLLCCVGLILLSHFRRLFPLFFQWMHADDDETVVLTLNRILDVVKLTWLRSSPYTARLVDELANLYKEAATRAAREEIRACICSTLVLLKQSRGLQFEDSWKKYKDDPNLVPLQQSITFNAATALNLRHRSTMAPCIAGSPMMTRMV